MSALQHSKLLKLVVKVGLTLAAFWFVLRNISYIQISDILSTQDHLLLLAVAAMCFGQMVLGAVRWRMILTALGNPDTYRMSLREAIKIYYIGVFFNNCLPGTVGGDVIRVWMTKSEHVPLPVAIHSVIIDRLIALIALGALVALTLPLLGQWAGFNGMLLAPPLVALGLFGLWLLLHVDRILSRFAHLPVIRWIQYFISSLRLMVDRPGMSALSLVYATLGHVIYCASACVLVYSLGGSLSFIQSVTLIPLVILAIMLPVSIGGWGMREAAMVTMLGLVGVKQAVALMLGIEIGLISMVVNLPGGLLWFVGKRHSRTGGNP